LKIVAGEGARDPEGFDRDAMHVVMNREIVDFFDRKLGVDRDNGRPGSGQSTPSRGSRRSKGG
jgi:hypothetical protein